MNGTVRLSLDFECGWGAIDNDLWRRREMAGVYTRLRPALCRFTARLDELAIPAVWAPIGAMITDPGAVDLDHLGGGYADKAAAFVAEAAGPTRDGRDLLDMVLAMRTPQRFGTHGYSHVTFTDAGQDGAAITAELARACAANRAAGIAADRLVFPENRVGHLDVVEAAGIAAVRMPPHRPGVRADHGPSARPGLVRRALRAVLAPPAPVREHREGGLVLHHATDFLNWGAGAGRIKRWSTRRRIDRALALAGRGGDVHFWLHPFNLAETPSLADFVDAVLLRIARLRDGGAIGVEGF